MAQTLQQIIDSCRQIIDQTDSSNSHFTDAQLTIYINEGYRFVTIRIPDVSITSRTYTTANTITLNSGTVQIDIAKFLSQPSNQWIELEVIDLQDLLRLSPDWENEDAGIPKYCVRVGAFSVQMHPPLDSDNLSQADGFKTYGLELPADLSATTDTTVLPHHLDDILAHWAAYRCFQRLGDGQRAGDELTLFRGIIKDQKATTERFAKKRGWKWHDSW